MTAILGFIGLGLFFVLFTCGMSIADRIEEGDSLKYIITGKK